MLGTRGIWEDGWKAAAVHAPLTGKGHFDKDRWELYHVDADRAESKDLARKHPEKLKALIKAWFEEAEKNLVLPLDDRTRPGAFSPLRGPPKKRPASGTSTIRARAAVPESVAVNVRGRSYKILADVEITDPNCSGVIFAHGSRFGGHSLFIKDKKLYYVYNFLGIKPEQKFVSPELKPGKYTLGMEFTREKAGQHHESLGTDQALCQRQGRGRRPDARAGGQVHPVRRRAVRRVRQRRRRQRGIQVARQVQGRDDPLRRRHRREGPVS